MNRYGRLFLGLALALGAGGAARAQTDGDLALLAGQSSVPPNVVLLFDTSGSMNHVAWHQDFDMFVFWDRLPDGSASPSTQCNIGSVPREANSTGDCPDSRDPNGNCPNSESSQRAGNEIDCPLSVLPLGCAGWPGSCELDGSEVELELPDYSQAFSERTRWSRNYLHWYITATSQAGGAFQPIPAQTRTQVGQDAFKKVIDQVNPDQAGGGYQENVRFGLAELHGGNGAFITVPIGPGNKPTLMNAIDGLDATGSTPLSEALVDMARYYVGQHDTLGAYSQYDRNTTSGASTSSPPPSPIDPALTCQSNFVVVMTDGQPTRDLNDHHGSAFSTTIGDYDADGNDGVIGPSDRTDYLDDVASYLASEDLIADSVMAGQNNIITYTIGFAIDFPLLKETAQNGLGEYYTTSSANELAAQLGNAIQSIIDRSATFASALVPSSRSQFGDGFYTGYFEPKANEPFWPGHLEAYRITQDFEVVGKNGQPAIDPATGLFLEPRRPIWDAAHKLAGTNGEPPHPSRVLYTNQGGARTDFTAANLSAADLALTSAELGLYPNDPAVPFATVEDLADAVVNYTRGEDAFDDDRDGLVSETRPAVLGDIFHSNPIVVGTPPPTLLDEPGFGPAHDPASFFGRFALRPRKLYVGANDGMLHGFNAGVIKLTPTGPVLDHEEAPALTGGQEAFGYVPGFLLDKVKELPLQTLNSKSFYVDGSPSAGDAWLAGGLGDATKEADEWTTVLVTGMRRGGDGYVALDVTDPGATGGAHGPFPRLLWEFADPSQPLGETWSKPVIARVRLEAGPGGDFCDTGLQPAPDCREQWVAIFAGGYRAEGDGALPTFADPTQGGWTSDSKALFIVSLETGQVLARAEYQASDPVLSRMIYSLPSTPAVLDIDFDGFVDVIYVGDTGGQLWKWDVSEIGRLDAGGRVTNWPVGIFFEAPIAANGHPRSIFFPPSASFVNGELTLSFGTGERTDLDYASDPAIDDRNRFYVIADPTPTGPGALPAAPYGESDLTPLNGLFQDPDPTDLGFYLVSDPDEKFVTNHVSFAGFLITASYTPNTTGGTNACTAGGGTAFLYVFELDAGGGFFDDDPNAPADATRRLALGTGVPTDPKITTSSSASGGSAGGRIVIQTSRGALHDEDAPGEDTEPVEIVYWRQEL